MYIFVCLYTMLISMKGKWETNILHLAAILFLHIYDHLHISCLPDILVFGWFGQMANAACAIRLCHVLSTTCHIHKDLSLDDTV